MAKDIENTTDNIVSSTSVESTIATSFFYTSDKFINALDNEEILRKLENKFHGLNVKNTDAMIKKSIV